MIKSDKWRLPGRKKLLGETIEWEVVVVDVEEVHQSPANYESEWRFINNVRRLFLTVYRWIDANLSSLVFEPNTPQLWLTIERELTPQLWQKGALKGQQPADAYYGTNNPQAFLEQGMVLAEMGLAAIAPGEFIQVVLVHGDRGVELVQS